ncbi:SDR family NAD(P)-dependent oxidoreductase [Mucilaginibacter myungsuensis]|uniref:SDR family NAD(P)-dependent oxidoreductase n=1 Tax=Mucilaginibacter myungsuensis TaxID=649104 RepID=A0A929L186_9SPHI|nr:SDR family NAD(P)-dependent oxidoreductase [Mucilaginibacter myungsuensis]MBE9662250.1 SDR family NAD(P)-dependent oxidoreductase [Mucilaginibacter myungsuensis]MDN3599314.1 SDR family NAD(P)-dependent oxidoreductase [Mucilaginibacter myungsuensis]
MSTQKVWFVTGASKGFGLEFVKQLLAQGDKVAATSRKVADLSAAVEASDNFVPLAMDITSEDSVTEAIDRTVKQFGKLDVVVNNAGYGLIGALEELSYDEAKGNFEVNVYGSLNVIRAAMPHLRQQGSGHIFNISSIGGYSSAFPGWGIYCATKFAVQGFTGSLAEEVKDLGIKVTAVYPGYFRTEFLTSGSVAIPKNPIDAYQAVRDSQEAHQNAINGNQPGDPEKGVAAIIKLASEENPPVHFFLGEDAYNLANQQMGAIKAELEEWKELTVNTNF